VSASETLLVMAWTFPCRIISASDSPSSAVDIAPAIVRNILPPPARSAFHASAASTRVAELKCRKWCFRNALILMAGA